MPRGHVNVPDETSALCEGCGYTLDGLPTTGQCPECGRDIAQSIGDDGRKLPAWEDPADRRHAIVRFLATSAGAIFATGRFYRALATRRQSQAALWFARLHWSLSAILLGGALSFHVRWSERYLAAPRQLPRTLPLWIISAVILYLFLWGVTRIAARLTAFEAGYRGIRLPRPVVLRGLYYHASHFFPVSLAAFLTVWGNWRLLYFKVITPLGSTIYLYLLCAEVLVGAAYLFLTYWTGMKNMMYANR